MTSSGIGGANGHCVVEGPPPPLARQTEFWMSSVKVPALLVSGGLSPRSTTALASALNNALATPNCEDAALARVFGRRARSMTWRSCAVSQAGQSATFGEPVLAPKTRPPIVFVFSGQGTQYFDSERVSFLFLS